MPRLIYTEKNFGAESEAVIRYANQICAEYAQQGFDLTLRQLYYQFVSRDLIPNNDREYKRLGKIVSDARLAGLLDWNYIIDRTRELKSVNHYDSPKNVLEIAAEAYRIDKWDTQPVRVEVWIEKDALVGVIDNVCHRNDVPFFSCRGYTSQSEMWEAGQRIFDRAYNHQQKTLILHLGDHDPSGIDMTRDIEDRLSLFFKKDGPRAYVDKYIKAGWVDAEGKISQQAREQFDVDWPIYTDLWPEVMRIALNYDQVEEYGPPPNPAKLTDVRAKKYIAEYGESSWELDALEPSVLVDLVEEHVEAVRDEELWDQRVEDEDREREHLRQLAEDYEEAS